MKRLLVILALCGAFMAGCGGKDAAKDAEEEKMIHETDSMAGVMEEAAGEIRELEADLDSALNKLEE